MPKRIAVIAAFGLLGSLYSDRCPGISNFIPGEECGMVETLWCETYPDQLVMNGLQRATGK